LIEARPLGLGPTDPIGVLLDDVVATLAGHLAEIEELSLRVLIDGRDSHREGGALHQRRPFGFGEPCLEMSCWMKSSKTSVMFWPWAAVMDLKVLCRSTGTLRFILSTCGSSAFLILLTFFHRK
jgi:hypothetical protein